MYRVANYRAKFDGSASSRILLKSVSVALIGLSIACQKFEPGPNQEDVAAAEVIAPVDLESPEAQASLEAVEKAYERVYHSGCRTPLINERIECSHAISLKQKFERQLSLRTLHDLLVSPIERTRMGEDAEIVISVYRSASDESKKDYEMAAEQALLNVQTSDPNKESTEERKSWRSSSYYRRDNRYNHLHPNHMLNPNNPFSPLRRR